MDEIDLRIDVTDAARLGEAATMALTVHVPEPAAIPARPIVCFAKPGGAFARGYFTSDLPGPASGAQARWHAQRGWVFVSVDHLGVGDSSTHDMSRLDYTTLAAAADSAEREVLRMLSKGLIGKEFPIISDPVVLGLGQSMGASTVVFQQAHHSTYDGIAVLGFGVMDMHVPVAPGETPFVRPWIPRDAFDVVVNARQVAAAGPQDELAKAMWFWFWDDVDVATAFPGWYQDAAPWISSTVPGVVLCAQTPGVVFTEAAAVDVPVLLVFGERDVCLDRRSEPRAYQSAPSVDLFLCPAMGHMHNFAGTRELLWTRIENWSQWVAAAQRALTSRREHV
jgi:pimeloyl-ACP methyl ester carboxylesterase